MKTNPLIPIPHRPDEEPIVCIPINRYWLAALSAMVYPFRYPEAWTGTLEENQQARADVLKILFMLMDMEDCQTMACCDGSDLIISQIYRVDPDNIGELQTSIDGGITWVHNPKDPRDAIVQPAPGGLPGIVTFERCDKAVNIVQELQNYVDITATRTGTLAEIVFQILADLIALLALPSGVGAAILVLIYPIANAIKQLGEEAYRGLFTEAVWDAVRCALYCEIPETGLITQENLNRAWAKMRETVPDGAGILGAQQNIGYMLATMGLAGVNLASVTGSSQGADCSDCDDCLTCDSSDASAYSPNVANEVTILSDNSFSVEGINYAGSYRIMICTGGHTYVADGNSTAVQHDAPCFIRYEMLAGSVQISNASGNGKSFDERITYFSSGGFVWMVELLSTAPFTVKFTIS